jgi:hypothetical protein
MSRRLALVALALATGLGLCHALCYSPQLPEQVAVRFDTAGVPVAWADRTSAVDLQLTLLVATAALFLVLAGSLLRTPPRWFSLPHAHRWLAPSRIDRTRRDIAGRLLLLGALTQLLLVDLHHRAVRVNLGRSDHLESGDLALAAYLALVAAWTVLLLRRYLRQPADA